MQPNEYQKKAWSLAFYLGKETGDLTYPTLGLAGETGEVCEKVKKLIRDGGGVVTEEFKFAVEKELGDVQWYLAALCSVLGLTLEGVMQKNIEKLEDRTRRGVRHGSGDAR